jgi:hypothetical protein
MITPPLMPATPAVASTAPMSPPNMACDDDDGMPTSQVARFHRIAPTSPASTISGVTSLSSTMPDEMVLATSVDSRAPTRLSTAAMATAVLGRSAPVATDVAIAFAASWKPLVKSKMSATTTTIETSASTLMDGTSASRSPAGPFT